MFACPATPPNAPNINQGAVPHILYIFLALTRFFRSSRNLCGLERCTQGKMAEASAADGKIKHLNISETKKNKKDGAPKTAAKKPQQQKKKVSSAT